MQLTSADKANSVVDTLKQWSWHLHHVPQRPACKQFIRQTKICKKPKIELL